MFIIISGIIIIILVLGFCYCDSLIKYYIANVLSNEFKWGEKNNEVLLKIIKDTLHKEYDEIIKRTISEKTETYIECLGFSIKHKLNNIDYQLSDYGQYREKLENELKEKFDQMKNEVNEKEKIVITPICNETKKEDKEEKKVEKKKTKKKKRNCAEELLQDTLLQHIGESKKDINIVEHESPKEKTKIKNKLIYKKRKSYFTKYRKNHKKAFRLASSKYYKKNKDEILQKKVIFYKINF